MKVVVGCDLEDFKEYYKRTMGWELDVTEENIIMENPSHLILWREDHQIIGHAIWHESNTEEHRKGLPRDKMDREILKNLLKGKKDFIELHEIWLRKEHRGKGYGRKFFEFFEEFVRNRGYDSIVYYADHPAAIAICRQRGYEEAYGVELAGKTYYVFYLSLRKKNLKG